MKKIIIEVCACTKCTLMGGLDIIEQVESLRKLKSNIKIESKIEIHKDKKICSIRNTDNNPVVTINGHLIIHATPDKVMEKIIMLDKKEVE